MSHLVHLARRFLRSLVARRPGPEEQDFVAAHLEERLAEVFWRQPVPDLDHALRGARWLAGRVADRPQLVTAYLLHDVGKRHSRLGTWGRSMVTALSLLRLPVGGRGRSYLDHGPIGAEELEAVDAPGLAVSFARHHTGPTRAELSEEDWGVLLEADRR